VGACSVYVVPGFMSAPPRYRSARIYANRHCVVLNLPRAPRRCSFPSPSSTPCPFDPSMLPLPLPPQVIRSTPLFASFDRDELTIVAAGVIACIASEIEEDRALSPREEDRYPFVVRLEDGSGLFSRYPPSVNISSASPERMIYSSPLQMIYNSRYISICNLMCADMCFIDTCIFFLVKCFSYKIMNK